MVKFGHFDWTRMIRGEMLSQGNRLKEFELGSRGDSRRQAIFLGCCEDVANSVNRSLLDPTSVLREGPDSWPFTIDVAERDQGELSDTLSLFTEVLTLTRAEGLDEAIALDFHTDAGSESGGNFNRTAVGELVLLGKYRSDMAAGKALADRLLEVAVSHPRLSRATVVVSVQGTNHTFGERLAEGVARRMTLPFEKSLWLKKPVTAAKEGRPSLDLQGCLIDRDLEGHVVLIVDDMWRTGVSTKSVAAQARTLGAAEVFGLCCTRTLRN